MKERPCGIAAIAIAIIAVALTVLFVVVQLSFES